MEPDSPPRKRYSRPLSPRNRRARSKSRSLSRSRSRDRPDSRARQQNVSRSRSRSRSRGRTTEVVNPGNTLYVTGLSTRVTERELDEHFSKEGKSRRKRPRTPTPGHYLGLSNSREGRGGGDRHRLRRDDYEYRRPPRRSPPYQGGGRVHSSPYHSGREYSPLPRRSPHYSGRSRRERTRSPPPYSQYGSPDRGYTRGGR